MHIRYEYTRSMWESAFPKLQSCDWLQACNVQSGLDTLTPWQLPFLVLISSITSEYSSHPVHTSGSWRWLRPHVYISYTAVWGHTHANSKQSRSPVLGIMTSFFPLRVTGQLGLRLVQLSTEVMHPKRLHFIGVWPHTVGSQRQVLTRYVLVPLLNYSCCQPTSVKTANTTKMIWELVVLVKVTSQRFLSKSNLWL